MRFTMSSIPGAQVIDPTPHEGDRGRFIGAWCTREFAGHGLNSSMGFSVRKGTHRGMHFQVPPDCFPTR